MKESLKRCEYCGGLNLPLATKCEHCGGNRFEPEEAVKDLYRSGAGQAMKDRIYIGSHLCLSGPTFNNDEADIDFPGPMPSILSYL